MSDPHSAPETSPARSEAPRIKLFDAAPEAAAKTFADCGVVVLPAVVSAALFELMEPHLVEVREALSQTGREFLEHKLDAAEAGLGAAIVELTAAVAGVDPSALVLAELLLSAYGDHARPEPSLHKDRLASEIAVGVPLRVPPASTFVYTREGDADANPFDSASRYDELLDPGTKLSLRCASLVTVPAGRGDVLLFPGSGWFHGRRDAAGTVVLYAKLNTLGLDPQAIDPRTRATRWSSLALAMDADSPRLLQAQVMRAPQLVGLGTFVARNGARIETAEFKDRSVRLEPADLALLDALSDAQRASKLRAVAGHDPAAFELSLRRLVRLGVLDLVEVPR